MGSNVANVKVLPIANVANGQLVLETGTGNNGNTGNIRNPPGTDPALWKICKKRCAVQSENGIILPCSNKRNATAMIIGYTTGVFDMFHVGHLNLLRRARENCDRLIVGVSTDEVVREYKHHDPIVPFNERVEIVKAIRYADEVVPQTSMDKFAAWERLRFNRLFHGNDWKGSAMYNEVEAKLRAVGVEVVYFEYTKGTSSTLLSERLRNG